MDWLGMRAEIRQVWRNWVWDLIFNKNSEWKKNKKRKIATENLGI